jgi:hypothetical protein
MPILEEKKQKDFADLVTLGTEIAGASAGAGIGFVMGGAPGAIVGAACKPILSKLLFIVSAEFTHRQLGHREKVRIGATLAFAAEKIEQKLAAGMKIRDDGFFDKPSDTERSAADEIVEGVLIAAQKQYEENKLPYLGNLFANICFVPQIESVQANFYLRLAEALSYRQLCLLALFSQKENFKMREEGYAKPATFQISQVVLLHEIFDLYNHGLINNSGVVMLDLPDIRPQKMNVQGSGITLYQLMELAQIDKQELEKIATQLS